MYNKEKYPKYSSVYAGTLAHLAITYRMMEKYGKAKNILEESVKIYKQIRPENHPDIGRNVLNLGIIYGEIKENIKAKELLEKSLNDYENNSKQRSKECTNQEIEFDGILEYISKQKLYLKKILGKFIEYSPEEIKNILKNHKKH